MNVERKFSEAGPADRDLRPVVQLPQAGIPGIAIAAIGIVLALVLFLFLDSRRTTPEARHSNAGDAATFSAPPPLAIPPLPPVAVGPPSPETQAQPQQRNYVDTGPARIVPRRAPAPVFPQPIMAPFPQPAMPAPSTAAPPVGAAVAPEEAGDVPAVVIDSGVEVAAPDGTARAPAAASGQAEAKPGQPAAGDVHASTIANRTTVIPAGTLIPAVLETPIDTSRPGLVRAIVSRDTKGFDGRKILVPRGSRVVGVFQGDRRSGHNGVLVNWTRLIRPDGVAVELDSPATDSEGESGIPGQTHGFFLGRFLASALQSALYVGESLLVPRVGTTVLVGLPVGAATSVAQQNLVTTSGRDQRITVRQGVQLNIFVAHDLDFSSPQPTKH